MSLHICSAALDCESKCRHASPHEYTNVEGFMCDAPCNGEAKCIEIGDSVAKWVCNNISESCRVGAGCYHVGPHSYTGVCSAVTPCGGSCKMVGGHEGWGTPVSNCECPNCSRLNIERAVGEYYSRKDARASHEISE